MNWRGGIKWLNFTFVIPLLVLTALTYILLFSQAGLSFSLWAAQKFVPELTIEQSKGQLLGQLQLTNIQWQQNQSIQIKLEQLDIDLNIHCLLSAKVCVKQLHLAGVQAKITSPDTASDKTASSPEIFLPFPVSVQNIAITNADIVLDGNQITWQNFSAKLDAWGNKIQLDNVLWQNVDLTPATEQVAATVNQNDAAALSYQALQLNDINLPVAIYVSEFTLANFTLHTETTQHIPLLQLAIQAHKQKVNITRLHLQHKLLTLDANLNITLAKQYPLFAQLDILLHEAPLAKQKLHLVLDGSLDDLAIKLVATDNIQAELEAKLALLTDDLPLEVSLTAKQPNSLALDDNTSLTLNAGTLNLVGSLQQLQVKAKTDYKLTAMPKGSINLLASVTPLNAKIDSLVITALGGTASLSASIDWQQAISWQSKMRFNDLNPGLLLNDYPGALNGQLSHQGQFNSDGSWLVTVPKLNITGQIKQLPFTIQGDLQAKAASTAKPNQAKSLDPLNNISFNAKNLSVIHGGNSVQLTGSLAKKWQLNAKVNIPDLNKSLANSAGVIKGDIAVSGARLSPTISTTLNASKLSYQQFALDSLQLDGQLNVTDQLNANINLEAKQGSYQHYDLEQLTIKAQGNEQQHKIDLALQSNVGQAKIAVSGNLQREKDWQGILEQASLSTVQGAWILQKATSLNYAFAKQQLTISQHCWQQTDTSLCLEQQAKVSAKQGAILISLNEFLLASLSPLLPSTLETKGKVNANISANWLNNAAPTISLSVQGQSGQIKFNEAKALTLPWQDFSLQLHSTEQLTADLKINFNDKTTIVGQALITDLMQQAPKLNAQLNINAFSLDFLQPLVDSNSQVSAEINSQLQLDGLLSQPELSGILRVDNINIIGKKAPTEIKNGDISLNFLGDAATITGSLETPDGKIALTGNADWNDIADWHASLKLAGDALSLQVPNISLKVKPDLKVDITPQLTLITGTVEVPSANISIDDLPQSAVGISSDTILLDEQGLPMQQANAASIPIHTDIKVILNKNIKLQSFGLVTQLSGELSVKQQDKGPQLYGEVDLVDGTFRSYGQDLLIRRGKLKFNGPADQPYLDIEAIRNPLSTEDNVIAGIKVTGPADEPIVSLFSEPSKPQANTLAYLTTGRDIGSDSGNTSDAITTSLIGMSIASSSKLVGNIGAAFGINDLSLDTAGAGDNSQVTVSGHLSRDLELKYGYGIFNAIGEFTVRYRIMRRLYLESVSGLDNTVDLLYKFEFD